MAVFLGIDVGTSGVKSVLVDLDDEVRADATAPLAIDRPRPLWSEQWPESWWAAVVATLDRLAADHPSAMTEVAAIGLSGQMLGVALLDEADLAIRPALLWNDGRAGAECEELAEQVANFATVTGARPMPGFPAAKLRWLAKHEGKALARAKRILLPKDFVRLKLTGEAVSDLADTSATLLLDTLAGRYHEEILAACGVQPSQLPPLVASDAVSARLDARLAGRWGLPAGIPVAGGAGDNMAGAVGAGVVKSGQAFISLGTSGVYFLADDRFRPAHGGGMHTHRHAVAGLFAQHGVVLSAAASLAWIAEITGGGDVGALVASIAAEPLAIAETPVFTPYLAGERTPHDDPTLTGAFSGLTLSTTRRHLVQGVMEGVALALADCDRALSSSDAAIESVALIGGGARSRFWAELVASAIERPLHAPASAAVGPALGAARLARKAVGGPLIAKASGLADAVEPRPDWTEALRIKRQHFAAHLRLRGPQARSGRPEAHRG